MKMGVAVPDHVLYLDWSQTILNSTLNKDVITYALACSCMWPSLVTVVQTKQTCPVSSPVCAPMSIVWYAVCPNREAPPLQVRRPHCHFVSCSAVERCEDCSGFWVSSPNCTLQSINQCDDSVGNMESHVKSSSIKHVRVHHSNTGVA